MPVGRLVALFFTLLFSFTLLGSGGAWAADLARAAEPEVAPAAASQSIPEPSVVATAKSLPDLQTLLDADSESYPQSKRCLSVHKLNRTRILDENHVVFELRGGRYYLAQLEHRCPGLTRNSIVSFVHSDTKVCAKDGIRGVPITGGFTPSCQLPEFMPVTKEQIALLKEGLKGNTFKTMKSKPIKKRP